METKKANTSDKYKPKVNLSYTMAIGILEAIILNYRTDEKLDVKVLKEIDFYNILSYKAEIEEILINHKEIPKEALRLLRIFNMCIYKQPKYNLSLDRWFKDRYYKITDNQVLSELIPLLMSYVGKTNEANYSLFFEKIDTIIEYIIKPSYRHNKYYNLEYKVDKIIKNIGEIEIPLTNGKFKTVEPLQIVFTKDKFNRTKKLLIYKDKHSRKGEILLEDLFLDTLDNVQDNKKLFSVPTTNLKTDENTLLDDDIEVNKNIEVILECEKRIYEYFELQPLSNMAIYNSEELILTLKEQQVSIEPNENKFYIIANDDEDKILSTVLHTINDVRIIKPQSLNNKLSEMFKKYLQDVKIDICKEDAPIETTNLQEPNPPEPSPNKKKPKKRELSDDEKSQIDNLNSNLDL